MKGLREAIRDLPDDGQVYATLIPGVDVCRQRNTNNYVVFYKEKIYTGKYVRQVVTLTEDEVVEMFGSRYAEELLKQFLEREE